MNDVHLGVAGGRRLSSETARRLSRLLDGEILPRLERPGRYVGLQGPEPLEAPPQEAPVHLLWPGVPEGPQTAPELEPLRAALQARGIACCSIVVPTPELGRLLHAHELRYFDRDRWEQLEADARWCVWLEEPGQLLGLLAILQSAGLPLRREGGGPRVLVAGPACVDGFALAEVYADRVLRSVDPEAIADALSTLPERPTHFEAEPATPGMVAEFGEAERGTRCLSTAELRLPWRRRFLDRDSLPRTQTRVGAGSAALRERLGLPQAGELRSAIEGALDEGSLELLFALGLPTETAADRGAIVDFAEQVLAAAGDRRRRVEIQIAFCRDGDASAAELAAWADELCARLGKCRLRRPQIASLLRDRRLVAATRDDADWFESLFHDGMWAVESELAQNPNAWDKDWVADETPRPGPTPQSAHAPTGLRREAPPQEAAARQHADRWRRWSAMIPQQFDYRLEFARRGRLRHLSHRETGELLLRACHAAGVEVATAGIAQPRPKLSFGPSLAVGVEGLREYADLSLTRKQPHLQRILERHLPAGFALQRAVFVPGGIGRHGLNHVVEAEYEVAIPTESEDELRRRINAPDDLEQVVDIQLDASTLRFVLDLRADGKKLRPRDLLARLLEGMDVDLQLLKIRRTRLWAQAQGSDQLLPPWELAENLVNSLRARERACA